LVNFVIEGALKLIRLDALDISMVQACVLCSMEIGNTSLVFKKSDLTINSLIVPNQMTEKDAVCVNCFNQMLKNPKTNTNRAKINILVNILEKEMDKNEVNIDSVLEKMDTEMNKWSLSESVKTAYLVGVMDIIEVAIHDEYNKRSAINQIRKILSLNFDVKSGSKNLG